MAADGPQDEESATGAPTHCTWRTEVGLSAVGPDGAAWPQRLLEWMQEAAARASTQGGFPPDRYAQMGAAWFIREIHLAIDRPPRFGEQIAVETWVSDLRRFRSRRQYRMTVGDELVARGEVDWLFLEQDPVTKKVRPKHPDEAMKAAFPRHPEKVIDPEEVPGWPAPDAGTRLEPFRRRVKPTEIDRHGHVNHVHYLTWVEDHARMAIEDCKSLKFVRLFYDADAQPGDALDLSVADIPDGWYHRVHRGETSVLRAVVRRSTM